MSKQFLKVADLQLMNGGYLSNKEGSPVSNSAFVAAQKHAEYVMTFAKLAKGKDFKGKKADSLFDLENEVITALSLKKRTFVDKPTMTAGTLTAQLKEEALSFMNFAEDSSKVDKINSFLSKFETLAEFEEFGLFFEEDIVKLNEIYTMAEVVEAVTSVIDLLK